MTKSEATAWVHDHEDDSEIDHDDLEQTFAAIYGRAPDAQDREDGLWSLCCVCGCLALRPPRTTHHGQGWRY